jgi:hypothetical protein
MQQKITKFESLGESMPNVEQFNYKQISTLVTQPLHKLAPPATQALNTPSVSKKVF